jgi:hypothetical protein
MYKKYLKKAGENIILNQTKKTPKIFTIILIILFIVLVIASIILKRPFIYRMIFILSLIVIMISINIYGKFNGIYKNGLIANEYITWDEIHSYKWINNETISFLLKKGESIEFNNIMEREKIMEIINENKIKEKNS